MGPTLGLRGPCRCSIDEKFLPGLILDLWSTNERRHYQWETLLQSDAVSHWLGANLESPLDLIKWQHFHFPVGVCPLFLRGHPHPPQINLLTPNVRGPSYLGLTRSISWLLMPRLLTSPGHQQPWYWLCRIGRFLSYLRKDLKYLRRINVGKWHKIYVYVPSEKFCT